MLAGSQTAIVCRDVLQAGQLSSPSREKVGSVHNMWHRSRFGSGTTLGCYVTQAFCETSEMHLQASGRCTFVGPAGGRGSESLLNIMALEMRTGKSRYQVSVVVLHG